MILTDEEMEIREAFFSKESYACEDCFLGYLVWRKKYGFERIYDGKSLVIYIKNHNAYYVPFSKKEENIIYSINELLKLPNLSFERVTLEQKHFLENFFPEKFEFEEDRGNSDYLYDINSLCTLAGNKLSKKRNHINAFLSTYSDWHTSIIDKSNIEQVLDFAKKWYDNKLLEEGKNQSLDFEKESLFKYLPVLAEIGGDGIALYVDGKVVAFTAGQRISSKVYDTVFEKGSEEIRGSYNIINREFARFLKEKYSQLIFINRESDVNHAGLRQAKLSYMPAMLFDKFIAKVKN